MEMAPSMKKSVLFLAAFNALQGLVTAWQEEEESFPMRGCVDSKIEFPVWNSMRTCSDAEENSVKCNHHAFKRYCPVICDSCPDACEDQPFCDDHNPDEFCKKFWYARDCAVTCDFCPPVERGFVKIDEREGLSEDSHIGLAITMSSDSQNVFVAGTNAEKESAEILEYSGVENTLEPIIIGLDSRNKMVLDTSSDGKHLAVAFRLFDPDKLGRVEVYRKHNAIWDRKAVFYANSTIYGDFKFGQALRISDNGQILLIAMKSSVRVYDFDRMDWRPDVPIPASFAHPARVADASMTSDGNFVVVSTTVRSSIRAYRWSGENWTQHGDKISPLKGQALALFDRVRIVDDGETIFAASSRLFSLRGAIRVFDLMVDGTDTERSWKSRKRLLIKGISNDDRLGRELSISRDGRFVAWASNSRVGVLHWTGYNWQDEDVLSKTHYPTITMDPGGNYLAVGLPDAKCKLSDAGKIFVYKWDILSHPST